MKKKNLKSLTLNKKSISNFENNLYGGATGLDCFVSGGTNCLPTGLDCFITGGTNCLPTGHCISIFVPCITQTEHPTCRDCA